MGIKSILAKIGLLRVPDKDIILPFQGMQILVRNPRDSLIGKSVYVKGVWEKKATRFVASKIKPGMSVFDIGADIGYYTLLFAKLVGEKGRVYAFEPIPEAKKYIDKNVELNELKNVKSFEFAFFNEEREIILEDPFKKSKIDPNKKIATKNDIKVKTEIFDEWKKKEGIERVDLVKIDVEGAELNILYGMKNTLENQHPALFIEVHPEQLKSFDFSASDLMAFLAKHDYNVEPVDKTKIGFSQGNITIYCQ